MYALGWVHTPDVGGIMSASDDDTRAARTKADIAKNLFMFYSGDYCL